MRIWILEHPRCSPRTQCQPRASEEHGRHSVVQIDRGGQVNLSRPGQLVIYPLLDLRRGSLGVRDLVVALENSVIDYAAELGIEAHGSRARTGRLRRRCEARERRPARAARRELPRHGVNVCLDAEPSSASMCAAISLGVRGSPIYRR